MDEKRQKSYDWNWAACFAQRLLVCLSQDVAGRWSLFILANIAVSAPVAAIPRQQAIHDRAADPGLTFVTGGYGNLLYRRQIEKLVASAGDAGAIASARRHLAARADRRPRR